MAARPRRHVAHLPEDKRLVDRHRLAPLPAGLQHQVGADVVARHAAHRDAGVVAELALCRHLKELRAHSEKELERFCCNDYHYSCLHTYKYTCYTCVRLSLPKQKYEYSKREVHLSASWRHPHLVLTHAVTHVEDDPLTHHHMLILRVVVKTVVGLAAALELQPEVG